MASSAKFATFLSGFAFLLPLGSCSSGFREHEGVVFLGRQGWAPLPTEVLLRRVEGAPDILADLEMILGAEQRASIEQKAGPLEDALQPLFMAAPKNPVGNLAPDAVRYVLHRLFADRNGWFVQGLDTSGEAWNSSSPMEMFKGNSVHGLFEEHLHSHGFGLRQLAIVAAMFDSLATSDSEERLAAAYKVQNLRRHDKLQESEAELAIHTYMLMYSLGLEHTNIGRREIDENFKTILEVYPSWPETLEFVRNIRQSILQTEPLAIIAPTSWATTRMVLAEVESQWGSFQNRECLKIKATLVSMEEPDTGRVTLDNFYRSALRDNTWQFLENVPYLRQLGALDESDPQRMKVVIPNYMNSLSNCLASSKYYSVCCLNQCEPLLRHLETSVQAPEAAPEVIAELVAAMPSATTAAPGALSRSLVDRLQAVAAQHGGLVPLHGRLFAQWLHHVYPRECPYPHVSGTTKPQTPMDWMKATGEDVVATEDEMRRLLKEAELQPWTDVASMPWTEEEELFISRPDIQEAAPAQSALLTGSGMGLLLFAVPCAVALVLLRAFADLDDVDAGGGKPQQKYSF